MSGAGSIRALPLAAILIRLRFRSFRNGLRVRGRGRSPLLIAAVGVLISLAYVGLFAQAFSVIAATTDLAGQIAALAVVTGALAFGNLAAKAAGSEAVRAGSPENEFLLVRPVALSALVAGRGLADAVTDPVGALFLLPVLIAAALVWQLGALALPVAALTSMSIQIGISVLAYAVQLGVVRYVKPVHRRLVWMGLRLVAALSLATLWMLGTWVLRAPAALAVRLSAFAPMLARSPGALIAAPLAALVRGEPGHALLALATLGGVAAGAVLVATTLARQAGLAGWEEAGAGWADAAQGPRRQQSPTAATKDLLLIVRDRPQLLALCAMPVLFVGIQIFGAAGWAWSTESLSRISCLAYSLALYTATIGPLTHMQAERRAFWILRTVPVSLGALFAAKARAWALVVAGTAAFAFVLLSLALPSVSALSRLTAGLFVVGGAVGMSFLAVAMAASGADLSDEQGAAVGPATIYGFLLVGGLYNLVLVDGLSTRAAGLALYLFVIWAYWRAGVERAGICMDAEALRTRRLRVADGATLVVVWAVGARAIASAIVALDGRDSRVGDWRLGLLLSVGVAAAITLARRPRAPPRLDPKRSVAVALVLGALSAGALRQLALPLARLGPPDAASVWGALGFAGRGGFGAVVVGLLADELLFRGILQRALEEDLATRWSAPRGARLVAAVASVGLGAVAFIICRGGAFGVGLTLAILSSHAVGAVGSALTGRTAAAWLARVAGVAGVAFF